MNMFFCLCLILTILFDCRCNYKYGYPILSILLAKAYYSNNWKWVVYNVWGDNSWFYENVKKAMGW